jgi:PhoPQ-activated pathogenicity-related protein
LSCAGDYTALDRYIAAPDASYSYKLVNTTSVPGATIYQLDMTSQTWRSAAEVDRPEWRHWINIIKPSGANGPAALLFINGGSRSDNPPKLTDPTFLLLVLQAVQANAIIVDVEDVPNEPLKFTDESRTRSEDAIIAYSWAKFLQIRDDSWPARLPMTKAAVRAMDAASDFLAKSAQGGPFTVNRYIVAGASKRGWTTWSTAAVDPRVVAIAPMVFDALNMQMSFVHHYRAYGAWSSAVNDYVQAGVFDWLGSAEEQALLEIEDPFQYRDRLTMPKYEINAAGDQFFLPDSSRFYFADMPGEKYLRYVPNVDHSLGLETVGGALDVANGLMAWVRAQLENYPRPRFWWNIDRQRATMTVRTLDKPLTALLWQATNPNGRDFRLETIGPAYRSTPIEPANGVYNVAVNAPATGFTASFVEFTFQGPGQTRFVFTTEVLVTPDVYPSKPPVALKGTTRYAPPNYCVAGSRR